MLVLARRIKEAVLVGDMRIVVCEIQHGQVRLGFEGPENVKVLREELAGPKPKSWKEIKD